MYTVRIMSVGKPELAAISAAAAELAPPLPPVCISGSLPLPPAELAMTPSAAELADTAPFAAAPAPAGQRCLREPKEPVWLSHLGIDCCDAMARHLCCPSQSAATST